MVIDEDNKLVYLNHNKSIINFTNINDYPQIFNEHLDSKKKNILLSSLPKKFRERTPLAYFIELINVNEDKKIIMFLLMGEGVVFSVDFTEIVRRTKMSFWKIISNEFNYTVLLIVVANFFTFGIYFKLFRNGGRDGN